MVVVVVVVVLVLLLFPLPIALLLKLETGAKLDCVLDGVVALVVAATVVVVVDAVAIVLFVTSLLCISEGLASACACAGSAPSPRCTLTVRQPGISFSSSSGPSDSGMRASSLLTELGTAVRVSSCASPGTSVSVQLLFRLPSVVVVGCVVVGEDVVMGVFEERSPPICCFRPFLRFPLGNSFNGAVVVASIPLAEVLLFASDSDDLLLSIESISPNSRWQFVSK